VIRKSSQPLGPRKTLTDLAYERLKDDILSGSRKPGEVISTGRLAKGLGISAMPLRGALTILAAEGLVTIAPQRGVTVSNISPEELHENSIVRSQLEGLAANLACGQITEAHVATLERALKDMEDCAAAEEPKRWVRANAQFHELIIACCHNTTLVRLLIDLRHQGMRGRMVTGHVPGHMARRNAEHRRIIDAFVSKSPARAEQYMREHILAAGEELVEFVRTKQPV
jgi:DNA-binding GntR family transcriptional regulator